MNGIILSIFLFAVGLSLAESCNIQVKLRSKTDKEVQVQVTVGALKLKTERITFSEYGQKRLIKIKGERCNADFWTFQLWKRDGQKWVTAQTQKVKLEGEGWINVEINDVPMLTLLDRFGVMMSGL